VFDLEDGVRAALDHVRDGVAVRGTEGERLEDEEVERPLEELALERRVALLRHGRSVPLDHLPKKEIFGTSARISKARTR
jgi:hypothetical protein